VLDDGMETDMVLGTNERLLDQDLSAANFTTNWQILSSLLGRKEQRGRSILGRDVPGHPARGRRDQMSSLSWPQEHRDVSFVEVGWTVGRLRERPFYLEAVSASSPMKKAKDRSSSSR
jgi:CTP synthase